jgi:hypothetical protein
MTRTAFAVSAVALFAAAAGPIGAKEATLAVRLPSAASRVFWQASRAPVRWTAADATLGAFVTWHSGQPGGGVEWATLPIAGQGEAQALTLVLARIDPRAASVHLVWSMDQDRPAWTVDQAGDAGVALNAGMFVERLPWGWVVVNGHERLPPGRGPLSSALVGLADGRLVWVDGDDVSRWRGRADVRFAFQSYPTVLTGDGDVPAAVRHGEINVAHRDARLALGIDREGRLLVALTRFDAAIPGADRLPFGLTVPEMAAVMGALGARQAMLLDGGISAQLAISDSTGDTRAWKGLRKVPLALVVYH